MNISNIFLHFSQNYNSKVDRITKARQSLIYRALNTKRSCQCYSFILHDFLIT